MITNPRQGQAVTIWYGKKLRGWMPLHGKTGVVEIVCRGKPRNHGVRVNGVLYAIPCGNLQPGGFSNGRT
jgi:hypothetical protein